MICVSISTNCYIVNNIYLTHFSFKRILRQAQDDIMNKYIKTFSLINTICEHIGTRAYLWGGWIPDVYTNKILREHDDADYLILNLYEHRNFLQKKFNTLGWETRILENNDLKITKANLKVHFGHLQIAGNKAEWLHNGKLGKIEFPTDWLNNEVIKFQNSDLHAVKPEFQYVLKIHPRFMNQTWMLRDKDKFDLNILKKFLKNQDIAKLEKLMKNY